MKKEGEPIDPSSDEPESQTLAQVGLKGRSWRRRRSGTPLGWRTPAGQPTREERPRELSAGSDYMCFLAMVSISGSVSEDKSAFSVAMTRS